MANDVAHHQLHIVGSGARTVILEAGLGDTLAVWKDIQPKIADHCTRTVSYTRAGYVGSDPANGPRDAATIVEELREELRRRNIPPPYVLVGHSLGGLYMQYFARNFPGEVTGLLLIDSTHWDQHLPLDAQANQQYFGQHTVTLFMPLIMRQELKDSVQAGEQVHDSPTADDVRTIVLSSTLAPRNSTPESLARAAQLQGEIALDFPSSRHVFVTGATHYIQRDKPEVVINAARELAGCGELHVQAHSESMPRADSMRRADSMPRAP
ncbi:MAG TPA: alpha/beta hydrolase [Polyangiaceae bacterium]|nr:alpha/beta hydrolase [Polyangiaceae bacterium]